MTKIKNKICHYCEEPVEIHDEETMFGKTLHAECLKFYMMEALHENDEDEDDDDWDDDDE